MTDQGRSENPENTAWSGNSATPHTPSPSPPMGAGPSMVSGPFAESGQHATSEPAPSGLRCRTTLVGVLSAVIGGVLLAGSFVHPEYVVYSPGPAIDTLGELPNTGVLIDISGHETHPTEGALEFTTVSLRGGPDRRLTLWDIVWASMDRTQEIRPMQDAYPKWVTADQVKEENKAEMAGSQQEAVAVALRALGEKVTEKVMVKSVEPSLPANGILHKGDVVTAVNGQPVTTPASVTSLLQKAPADSAAKVTYERDGKTATATITPKPVSGRRVLGIAVGSGGFTFPFTVNINAGDVGGPSAGMMFALGVYDKLTPGALTGGRRIAGTGTIAPDGAVGPIGGIAQKMNGAVGDGQAEWFLAPSENCDKVYGNVPDGLKVVKVGTFTEALAAVKAIASGTGDSLPTCEKPMS